MADLERAFQGQRLVGSVTRFKDMWGWISCPDIGSDVFAHLQDVQSGELLKGASCSFEIGLDAKSGKPRARSIQVIVDAREADPFSANRVEGTLSHWKEPWGWVSAPGEERDIFAHREDICAGNLVSALGVGSTLLFEVGTDAKTGKPRALKIEVPHGQTTGSLPLSISKGKGKGKDIPVAMHFARPAPMMQQQPGWQQQQHYMSPMSSVAAAVEATYGGGKGGFGKEAPKRVSAGAKDPTTFIGSRLDGMVASWKDHWGWISSPLFTCDVFAHSGDLMTQQLPVLGTHVQFTVGLDHKSGKVRAQQITFGGGPLVPVPAGKGGGGGKPFKPPPKGTEGKDFEAFEGQQVQGTVASWRSPWGWINCQGFGADIFAHMEDVEGGGDLLVGESVAFTVGRDYKAQQRFRAREILRMDGGGEDMLEPAAKMPRLG